MLVALFLRSLVAWSLAMLMASTAHLCAQEMEIDAELGLFANVQTTYGAFTIKLDFEKAPSTVANFVGLAEGTQPWIDYTTGEVRQQPFYDGIVFHRVVEGFVVQVGSPAGDGTDGPGYTFRDEFEPTLRHDQAYVVSMANSGPHSNGSQFFVTLVDTRFLDDKHAVFGHVVSGQAVVDDIGQVTVDNKDRPIDPIAIESIVIRREGEAAEAFDVSVQGLPTPLAIRPRLEWREERLMLDLKRTDQQSVDLFRTDNLLAWQRERLPIESERQDLDLTSELAAVNQRFYRVAQVDYPESILTKGLTSRPIRDTEHHLAQLEICPAHR